MAGWLTNLLERHVSSCRGFPKDARSRAGSGVANASEKRGAALPFIRAGNGPKQEGHGQIRALVDWTERLPAGSALRNSAPRSHFGILAQKGKPGAVTWGHVAQMGSTAQPHLA